MAVVRHRNPVAVSHPLTEQFITLSRGQEFADNDPIVKEYGWAFEEDDTPTRADRVESTPIEQATAAPGEKRSTRRK